MLSAVAAAGRCVMPRILCALVRLRLHIARVCGLLAGPAIAVFVMGPGGASASAWNEPQGHGLVIAEYTFSGGNRYFDGQGHLSPASAYRKQEGFGYLEYGITDWLMAVIKPDVMATSVAIPNSASNARYVGPGTSELGAQVRLWAFGPAVMAAAGAFRAPRSTDERNQALIGNTSRDADARILFGLAFAPGAHPSFLDAQVGYRARSGGAPAEWHADATLGTRPVSRLLLLLQSFTTITEGHGTAWFPASRYTKLGTSAVWDLSASWSLEFGVFETVAGWQALRERGVKSAVWYRF
jgi:hypothetical protein